MTDPIAPTEEAIAWLDAHKGDTETPPLAIERRLEEIIGIPAMYDEWADPDCHICNGSGSIQGSRCQCITDLDNTPLD
jgi:hypothetical protein